MSWGANQFSSERSCSFSAQRRRGLRSSAFIVYLRDMKLKLYRIEKGIKVPSIAKTTSNGQPSMAVATMSLLEKGESFLVKDGAPTFQVGSLRSNLPATR